MTVRLPSRVGCRVANHTSREVEGVAPLTAVETAALGGGFSAPSPEANWENPISLPVKPGVVNRGVSRRCPGVKPDTT